jgi:hypothetical protein
MEKQTKNIITREWIEKELWFYNTADLKVGIGIFAIVFLVCIPFAAFFIGLIITVSYNLFFRILVSVLIGVLFIIPVAATAGGIFITVSERKKLKAGEFDIVVREMSYKIERATRRETILLLKFPDFREKRVDKTTYFHADIGDEFYIVHYRTNKAKKTAKLVYSFKMYEYVTE